MAKPPRLRDPLSGSRDQHFLQRVYEISGAIRKSTDAGATWNPVTFPGTVQSMVLDPRVSGHIFAISAMVFCGVFCSGNQPPYFYRSVDGRADWIQELSAPDGPGLIVDGSTNPTTLYDLSSRSVDGGITWTPITPPPGADSLSSAAVVDPSGTLYAAVYANGLFLSRDHAQTWTAIGSPVPPWTPQENGGQAVTGIVPAGSTGTLYATINQTATGGFVTRLSADGSRIVYSSYLRGHASMEPFFDYAAELGVFQTQNWISAIALDAAGNATLAGGTRAVDFPTAGPAQPTNAGLADAFVTTISADGSELNYSTYFGGSQDDGALAAAIDSQGNAIFAGQTWSGDFPVPGGPQLPFSYGNAFVVKLATGPPAISSVLNGGSYQPGIEAGSWVVIKGANLANSTRPWASSDFVDGNLPTSLDGVSVTIDGQPAFVEYVSPTQINVQAPSDNAVGAVNVVVRNNGATSAPASAQLQPFAPAFFMYGATSDAIASRFPDYALVGDPSAIPGAVAATPGDILVLWGTGFGATNPPVPRGRHGDRLTRGGAVAHSDGRRHAGSGDQRLAHARNRRGIPGVHSTARRGTHRRGCRSGIHWRRAIPCRRAPGGEYPINPTPKRCFPRVPRRFSAAGENFFAAWRLCERLFSVALGGPKVIRISRVDCVINSRLQTEV